LTPSGSDVLPSPAWVFRTSLSSPLGFLTIEPGRLWLLGSAIVMRVLLPVGLSPGIDPATGVEGGLGAGVLRREGASGRRRTPVGLFRIEGEGRSSGRPIDSEPVAVDETDVLWRGVEQELASVRSFSSCDGGTPTLTLLLLFFLSRSTSSTSWICKFINFFDPLVGGGLTITKV